MISELSHLPTATHKRSSTLPHVTGPPKMPSKAQPDDNLLFLFRCLGASDYKAVREPLPHPACWVWALTDAPHIDRL